MSHRSLDIVLVLVSLPATLPLALTVAVVVRIKLGSPVLFRQTRPGLLGRPFQMFKFRSMTTACDAAGSLLPDSERLTGFGRWLRATSLDELPEIWNVLKGEMSLVGPRPLLMHYLPRYSAEQARRHDIRPGITGWSQIRGRNAIGWDEKLALDVWYVRHQSFLLDVRILAKTVFRVLRRDGVSAPGSATMPEFMGSPATTSNPSSTVRR